MVHVFKIDDTNIVLDVYSGAVHTTDDTAAEMLKVMGDNPPKSETLPEYIKDELGEKFSLEALCEAYEDIKQLYKEDMLFSQDSYADIAANWNKKSVVKAMCLHITHDCNLRCEYCFADTGAYGGERSVMSAEVGKAAIDYVIKNSGARKNIEIDFFGGEPLINFDVVKEIVEYARKVEKDAGKNFRFTITTNGLLLDEEKKKYINENMVNIVLSLDGRKEINDKVRKRVDGSGSYDKICDKFIDMAESRNQDNYYVRGTFTSYNLDFAKDVLHLADLGFKQISVEPVVADKKMPYALLDEDIERINKEYEDLAVLYIKRKKEGKGFNFFHFMIDLDGGPCVVKRLSGCGAGHEYVAVAPNGDIYPCHQFVGMDEMKMGNVKEEGLDNDIKTMFEKSNIYTKPSCKDCFAKFYCSGSCPANAYIYNGDINSPLELTCKLQRKRVECALYCAVKQAEMEGNNE
ncbi:MAG: thioether cross-link-forming SCIFF peptide maturase [Ruminococcaceae bacterium]|nr:thioether cross-link-forming SCIFF peptide maturase [Oscillospiraceae bacterium]